ncbi:MAG: two-component regulator propeller domain-containing protein [Sedimenticola sp.]
MPHLSALAATDAVTNQDLKFEFVFEIGGEPSYSAIQDQQGFLWFTSFFNGMVRFDGSEVKRFRAGPDSISSDFATQVLEDSEGIIWIGTSDGLNRYDKRGERRFTRYYKDPDNPAKSLAGNTFPHSSPTIIEDRDGLLWFGTETGLSSYDRKSGEFSSYFHEPGNNNSLPSNNIRAVYEDSEGDIWIGTLEHGLARLDKKSGRITRYQHRSGDSSSLPFDTISSITEDQSGDLWVAATRNGLIRYSRNERTFTHFSNTSDNPYGLPAMDIRRINRLKNGKIFLNSPDGDTGLVFFDPKTLSTQVYRAKKGDPFSLSTNNIMQVLEDREGILWIAHNNGKVDKFDPKSHRFDLFRHNSNDPTSIANDVVGAFYQDRKGNIWLGTFGSGLDRFDPVSRTFEHFTADSDDPGKLPHGYPSGFFEDGEGNFYVSTWAGLVHFDAGSGKVVKRITTDTHFYTMVQDHEDPDIIWGTGWEMGLHRLNLRSGELKSYAHDSNNPNSQAAVISVRLIAERENPGILWIATWGGGLDRFDSKTGQFTRHQHDPDNPRSINSNTVHDVFQDSKNRIWVATDKGLNRLEREIGEFVRYGREWGFPATIVHNILEDGNGHLWIGTDEGVIRFDPDTEKVLRQYTVEDGLHSHNFFATARGQTRDGKLWFGGFNGLNSFHPDQLTDNETPPQVYLTSITRDDQTIKTASAVEVLDELHLSWRDNYFEFEYVALNYTRSNKNQYQYLLEGVDKNWYQADRKRFGRYVGLPGGEFTLRIRGSNNDGVWSRPDQEVALNIQVESPPWLTWWAYIVYLLTGTALILAFIRWRLRLSKQKQLHLQQLVHERTTELEVANKALIEARDKADLANEAKSVFLANMSHELRTPLNAILGFSEMLGSDPEVTAGPKEKVAIINRSGDHLLSMINDVLDLSKIEAGRIELEPEVFDLRGMLEDMERMFEVRAEQAGLRFDVELKSCLTRYLKADAGKLRQILINLLGNAVKFTRRGYFALRVTTLPVSGDTDMLNLHLEVEDSGPGIEPEQLKRIFQPFTQAGRTPSSTKGTGLGLAITQSFVKLMGGKISVENTPGKGSTFSVDVPVILAEESQVTSQQADSKTVKGLQPGQPEWRVLVVEDNADSRLLLTSLLSQIGFEIKEAENGEQAVELFKTWRPHLIWMDMRMPVMDGYEATPRIRGLPGGDEVKIVALTASAFKLQRQKIMEVGCNELVHKPYRAHEILDVMAEQLGVKYFYEDAVEEEVTRRSVALTAEMLKKLPTGLLDDLAKAVKSLSAEQMADVIGDVRLIDRDVADGLQLLVDNFQFSEINRLLKTNSQ